MKTIAKILFLAILGLVGCATQPVPTSEAQFVPEDRILDPVYLKKLPDSGEVIVKRDSGIGGSACDTRIFVDGKPMADLATSEKVSFHLKESDYIISAWPKNPCGGGMVETRVTVKRNQTLTFRVGYGSNGDFGMYPTAF